MSDSSAALLSKVVDLLKSKPAVTTHVAQRIYGAAPAKGSPRVYPYVVVSADSEPFAGDSFNGMKHTVRVQAFAREGKPGTVLAVRGAVYDCLNRKEPDIGLSGLVLFDYTWGTYFPEEDGKTFQSVAQFNVLMN